jgi:hypothetical protein
MVQGLCMINLHLERKQIESGEQLLYKIGAPQFCKHISPWVNFKYIIPHVILTYNILILHNQ